jgi:hypothetical protein
MDVLLPSISADVHGDRLFMAAFTDDRGAMGPHEPDPSSIRGSE